MYQLDAGRLKRRVSIYGYKDYKNSLNQIEPRLTLKAKDVPAEIRPVRAYERTENVQDINREEYRILIRYRAGITEKDVLTRGSAQFEITGIVDIDLDHVALELSCTEKKDKVILYG